MNNNGKQDRRECQIQPAKFVPKKHVEKPVCERRKFAEPKECDICTCNAKQIVNRETVHHSSNIDEVIIDAFRKGETIPEIASRLWTQDKEVVKEIWKDGIGMVRTTIVNPCYNNFIRRVIRLCNEYDERNKG